MRNQILIIISAFLILFSYIGTETSLAVEPYKTIENILYRDDATGELDEYSQERCRLDLYYPQAENNYPTVVWFHGGGLTSGGKHIPENLRQQKIAIAAANYRLYPKVKCPVYIDDAAAAIAWVFKNIEKYGGNPDLIFVSGHSAGGYLTSMVGMDKSYLAKYGINADRIAGLIPFSGHTITHFTVRQEMGIPGEQPIIDKYAPLYHVRPDAPPLVLITGGRETEMLGRYEENAYFYRMMKVVGHPDTTIYECPGFNHGSMLVPAQALLRQYIKKEGIHLNFDENLARLDKVLDEDELFEAVYNLVSVRDKNDVRSYPISKINPPSEGEFPGSRGPNELVIYTSEYEKPTTMTNEYGQEAVIRSGIVSELNKYNSKIPSDGYVVSGHGQAAQWIATALKPGRYATHNTSMIKTQISLYADLPDEERLQQLKDYYFDVLFNQKLGGQVNKEEAKTLFLKLQKLKKDDVQSEEAVESLIEDLKRFSNS